MTLTEFLLARIAEDEARALAAKMPPGRVTEARPVDRDPDYGYWGYGGGHQTWFVNVIDAWDEAEPTGARYDVATVPLDHEKAASHIAHWDPSRVLAECEAKRHVVTVAPWADNGGHAALADLPGRLILRALAAPYAEHPDYDPAWAV